MGINTFRLPGASTIPESELRALRLDVGDDVWASCPTAAARGTLTNTATILAPIGSTEVAPGDNVVSDVDNLTPIVDLAITNSDGVGVVSPRDVVTYTMVVTNRGPSGVIGASVTDLLPASLVNATWTCVAGPGSACAAASGTGSIDSTIDVALGGTVTFTVTATVADAADPPIVTTATVTPPADTIDSNLADNAAVDSDDVAALFALTITEVADRTDVDPGSSLGFTIVVSNTGPSTASDVIVQIPAGATVTLVVRTVVSADPADPTDIVNVAVASVGSSGNLTEAEATASATVRVTPEVPPIPGQPTTPTPVVPDPTPGASVTTLTQPLSSTGSDVATIILIAGIATLAGVTLLAAGRRRRQVTD